MRGGRGQQGVDEVSAEGRVDVTNDWLPGTLRHHGKLLEIQELLISGKVLKVESEF